MGPHPLKPPRCGALSQPSGLAGWLLCCRRPADGHPTAACTAPLRGTLPLPFSPQPLQPTCRPVTSMMIPAEICPPGCGLQAALIIGLPSILISVLPVPSVPLCRNNVAPPSQWAIQNVRISVSWTIAPKRHRLRTRIASSNPGAALRRITRKETHMYFGL